MATTSIKKKLFISDTPPATKDSAGYQGMSGLIQVKGIVSIGSIGFPHGTIEVPELETGITKTFKGARTGSAAQIAYATREDDLGQAAVEEANEAESEVTLMIVSPDGTSADFWTGIVHSLVENDADTSSYEGATFSFVPNYAVVKGAPVTAA